MITTHKIFFKNSKQMNELADGSIDLIVTSPPYPMIEMWDQIFTHQNRKIGKALEEKEGPVAFELMHRELDKVWDELFRVSKPGGIACINIGDATRSINGRFALYTNHSRIQTYMQKLGFSALPVILWRKQTNAPNKFMGSGMMPPGAYVTLEHEYVLILRKGNKKEYKTGAEKKLRKESAFFWEEPEALHFKYHYGNGYYKSWLESQKHLDAGTPYVEDVINDDIFDNTTVYDKASWVVYMLHNVLGDSLFIESMDNYFNHPALQYGAAYTSDLEAACEEIYGSDLSWFFNSWIYNPGNPDYVYSFSSEVDAVEGGFDTYVLLSQTQSGSTFPMPVDMRVFAGSYDTSFTVFNSQRGQLWQINTPEEADSVWIDRDEKILRTVTYSPEFTMSILADKEVDTAYIGTPYSAEYSVIAGIPPYTWTKISGQFPYGLVLTPGNPAILSGTPTWNSNFVFTLEVRDSDSPYRADTITLSVVVLDGVAPDVPVLLTPGSGETIADDTPLYSWSSTAGSGGTYTLQYADNHQFSTNVTTVTGLTGTSYEPLIPVDEGLWYWRVQAYSDVGTPSGYQLTPFNFTYSSGGGGRGDANGDGSVNVSDAVFIINYVFNGGVAPDPLYTGDVNCDDNVNVSDAVYIINYVFLGGSPPCSK